MFTTTRRAARRIRGTFRTATTRAASSLRCRRGTVPTLRARIEAYAPSPPRRLRSRCVVRGSSFSAEVRGGTTGPQRRGSAGLDEHTLAAIRAYYGRDRELWGEWGWTE